MKTIGTILGALLLLCSLGMAQTEKKTTSQVLDSGVKTIESELVPAAEAMPEDKYGFAPTAGEFKGVRTFAQQIKHIAAVNYIVGAAILGEKPPVDTAGESGPDSLKSKAEIVKYLKDSFAYAHKATASITDANSLEPIAGPPWQKDKTTRMNMAIIFAWHGFDHYGQLVEYLRMNGIVPPASRG